MSARTPRKISGKQRVTSSDVARLAGVSQATVSYVLNGHRKISPQTAKKVEDAIKELGYEPNVGARSLRMRRSFVIALIVHLDIDTYASETVPYINAVIETAREAGYEVVVVTAADAEEGIRRLVSRSFCDGFVVMDVTRHDPRLEVIAESRVPAVLMGRSDTHPDVDQVDADSYAGGYACAQRLAQTHDRVVVLAEDTGQVDNLRFLSDFIEGAHAAVRDCGRKWERVQVDAATAAARREVLLAYLREAGDQSVGYVARNPSIARALLEAAAALNLRAGQDFSVVLYATDAAAMSFVPTLTNVSQAPERLGSVAASCLLARLDDPDRPAQTVLIPPARLCERESIMAGL